MAGKLIFDHASLQGRKDFVFVRQVVGRTPKQHIPLRLMVWADHGPVCAPPRKEAVVALVDPQSENILSTFLLLRSAEVPKSCIIKPGPTTSVPSWDNWQDIAYASIAETLAIAVQLGHKSVAAGPFPSESKNPFLDKFGAVPFIHGEQSYMVFDQRALSSGAWKQFALTDHTSDFATGELLRFLGAEQIRLYWDAWFASFRSNPMLAFSRFVATTDLAREDAHSPLTVYDTLHVMERIVERPPPILPPSNHLSLPYLLLSDAVSNAVFESHHVASVILDRMKHHLGFLLLCLRRFKGPGMDSHPIYDEIQNRLHDKIVKTKTIDPELLRMALKETTSDATEDLIIRRLASDSFEMLCWVLGELATAPSEFAQSDRRLLNLQIKLENAIRHISEARREYVEPELKT